MPNLETPDELAENIADLCGVYGGHNEDEKQPCRICFTGDMTYRIREAVKNENRLNIPEITIDIRADVREALQALKEAQIQIAKAHYRRMVKLFFLWPWFLGRWIGDKAWMPGEGNQKEGDTCLKKNT
jgi:hypothetical protein